MIVRNLKEIVKTDRDVDTRDWNSRRLLLADDGMGFSMHDTIIRANTEIHMCYSNHVEAVYCVDGEGEIENLETGEKHLIKPFTLYALDGHEKHVLRGHSDMRMICVFNPPITGREVHDKSGAYPLAATAGKS